MGENIRPYAILFHTQGDNKVTFQEFSTKTGKNKIGFTKITKAAEVAKDNRHDYLWADTSCTIQTHQ